jgi:hypothetical protein
MLTSTSIAELVIYACSLRASLMLETTAHLAVLNRLQGLNRGEGSTSKVSQTSSILLTLTAMPFTAGHSYASRYI